MTGIYAPAQVPKDSWYLGPDNTLYQPQGEVISKGFRAYFTLASSLNTQGLRARVVMDGEMPTDVIDIQEDTPPPPCKKSLTTDKSLSSVAGTNTTCRGRW